MWVYWNQNLQGYLCHVQLLEADFLIWLIGNIQNIFWFIHLILTTTNNYYKRKILGLLNLGLTQNIPPNFWLISLIHSPTFTTWIYFQDGILENLRLEPMTEKKWAIMLSNASFFIHLGLPACWPPNKRALKPPKTFISNTSLQMCPWCSLAHVGITLISIDRNLLSFTKFQGPNKSGPIASFYP